MIEITAIVKAAGDESPLPETVAGNSGVNWQQDSDKEREILHSIIHDITDRKQAEDALRQSEANLKNSQEIAKLGSWTTDFKGRIFWSEEAYRIYGVNPDFCADY